jgi:16S rRNA (guanine1207-N2)-methyltransferase
METLFNVPQGQFHLQRLPIRKHELLRAWDAADEYLLQHVAGIESTEFAGKLVILNDSFGALATALHQLHPTAISDSYLSQQATRENLRLNAITADSVQLLDSLSLPAAGVDYLLLKIPKTLALLEYQLLQLRPLLNPDCKIIAAGMVKNLPPTAWKLLERLIGPTRPSPAQKKARLIFASLDKQLTLPANSYPQRYHLENSDWLISNHANVFSRDSLDIGTRLLLQHLQPKTAAHDVIDLGCGNGVVGLMLASQLPEARLSFVDESFMAVASARENFQVAFAGSRQAQFIVGDCLNDFAGESADYIVCNPPFHQQHTVGDQIAWQMFQQAQRVLRSGGELRIIGNRHLNYHLHLKKLFGNWQSVAGNSKFVILSAIK